jgi:hypothetical protein
LLEPTGPGYAYARFTGIAPIPVWSGARSCKVRLKGSGNRTVTCALYMIAVTQVRDVGLGRSYMEERLAAGKARTGACGCAASSATTSSTGCSR